MHFLKDRGFVHSNASDITPRHAYDGRRDMLKLLATGAAGATMAAWAGREAHAQTTRPGKLAERNAKAAGAPR